MQNETWISHPEYVGYEASSLGRVRSHRRNNPKILIGGLDKDGYQKLIIHQGNNSKPIHKRASAIIAECWIGPRPNGLMVCHKNGNVADNRPDNLEYKTQKANIHDKYNHGTMTFGEKNCRAVLSNEQVMDVFTSLESANAIADRLGLKSRAAIDAIRSSKTWTHITKSLQQPVRNKYQRRWKRKSSNV